MSLDTKTPFRCADQPTADDYKRLGVNRNVSGITIMVAWTGETRPPLKGEWYLSGAIVEGYRAHNDYASPYPIARLVKAQKRIITEIVE